MEGIEKNQKNISLKICIVTYNHKFDILKRNIDSILNQNIPCNIQIVDHSPRNFLEKDLKKYYKEEQVRYFFRADFNHGYGAGNNFGFNQKPDFEYFLVLNPDIEFQENVLKTLLTQISKNSEIGLIFPKVLNEDGSIQFNIKRHPTVLALIGRRFALLSRLPFIKKAMNSYEFIDFDYSKSSTVDFVGGCFMLVRSKVFQELEGFDEKYFMYFEDYDLCSKIRKSGYLIFYHSDSFIIHVWNRGSHKSLKLFRIFATSMLRFFWKWGLKWY